MRDILLTCFGILLAAAAAIIVVVEIPDLDDVPPIVQETIDLNDQNLRDLETAVVSN